jgi:hypothetical protein
MNIKSFFLLLTSFSSSLSLNNNNDSYNQRVNLRDEIYTNYCHDCLPSNIGETLNVSLGVAFRAFKSIDQMDGTISANIWLRYRWNDRRLKWDRNDYNLSFISLNTHPEADNKIWVPDIYLYNTAETPLVELDYSRAIVDYVGNVLWSRPGIITSTCSFDLTDFPYDQQECYLKFGSWSYDGNQLNLEIYESVAFDVSNFIEHEEWELKEYSAEKNIQYYNCCPEPYHDIKFFYNIRRNSGYYDLNIILPTFATSTLILMTLFVPWSSGERISFAVTVMLSIVVFLLILSDNLPKSDQKPLLSQMIIGLTLFSLLGVFFTILISALSDYNENYEQERGNKIIEFLFNNLKKIKICRKKRANKVYPIKPEPDSRGIQIEIIQREAFTENINLDRVNTNIHRTQSYNNSLGVNNKEQTIDKEECQEMINYFEYIYIIVFTSSFIIYCVIMFGRIPEY